jgi:hypothetical protein
MVGYVSITVSIPLIEEFPFLKCIVLSPEAGRTVLETIELMARDLFL